MANEIGTMRPGLSEVQRTSPTASKDVKDPPGKSARDAAARQAEEAREPAPLDDVVSGLNDLVHELHRELQFSIDEDSGDTVIKVIDRETDEVVRQIPPEEVLRLRKRLLEAAGVIFQDSA